MLVDSEILKPPPFNASIRGFLTANAVCAHVQHGKNCSEALAVDTISVAFDARRPVLERFANSLAT